MTLISISDCIKGSKDYFLPSTEFGKIFVSEYINQKSKGIVIIIPPYGRTVHDLFLIMAYLVANQFSVIRFDARNHVGMSTGIIDNYKISTIEKDLNDVLRSSSINSELPIIFVASSLSAPVAWKVSSQRLDIAGVISLVGAIDIVSTIEKAGNISLQPYLESRKDAKKYQKVLGFEVIGQPFVDDLIQHQYIGKEKIKSYISSSACPVYMIAARDDSWVSLEDVYKVINLDKANRKLAVLDNVDHEIGRSASSAKCASKMLVDFCKKIISDPSEVCIPKLTEIINASTLESERLNKITHSKYELDIDVMVTN